MCFNSLIINVLSFCFCLSFVIVLRLARNRVFCKVSNFYHHFFVFYFFFRNFALVKRFVNTYNGVDIMHKEMYFSVFFNVIYLEVSNILLTHTHTHTLYIQGLRTFRLSFFCFILCARKACRNACKQRSFRVSFGRCFVPSYKQLKVKIRKVLLLNLSLKKV